jgi:hypothetical protein
LNGFARQLNLYARVTAAVLYCSLMAADLSLAETLDSLDALRWERRVLLVFAAEDASADVIETLRAERGGLDDRDVTWLVLEGDIVVETNHGAPIAPSLADSLRQALSPIGRPLDVLLIGKDGGLKQRVPALEPEALFELIDGMPMRRREVESRRADAGEGRR